MGLWCCKSDAECAVSHIESCEILQTMTTLFADRLGVAASTAQIKVLRLRTLASEALARFSKSSYTRRNAALTSSDISQS